jgi:galactose-1-phosphate uridylyltransferase
MKLRPDKTTKRKTTKRKKEQLHQDIILCPRNIIALPNSTQQTTSTRWIGTSTRAGLKSS